MKRRPDEPRETARDRKVVVVTDGLSHSGLAIAIYLTRAGHEVFGTVSKAIRTIDPLPFRQIEVDPRDERSVRRAVAEVAGTAGRVDALVNNAGVCMVGALEEVSAGQSSELFQANFFDALRMTYTVLPLMREQGAGRVVNLVSMVGAGPTPYLGVYGATQAALESWSTALSQEIRTEGICVSLVRRSSRRPFDSGFELPDRPLDRHGERRLATLRRVVVSDDDLISKRWLADEILAEAVGAAVLDAAPKRVYSASREAKVISTLWHWLPRFVFDCFSRCDCK